jgi:hypothetical protein
VAANDVAIIEFSRVLYRKMAIKTVAQLVGLEASAGIIMGESAAAAALAEHVAALAESVYQAEFLGMAIDYQPFSTWSTLQDQAAKGTCGRTSRPQTT